MPMIQNTVESKKEIDLFDYLFIIWKWKYLIMAGTIMSAVIAFMLSYSSAKQEPEKYNISVIVQSPIKGIDDNGRFVYLDSPENIKPIIEGGMELKGMKDAGMNATFHLNANVLSNSNLLKISCETASPEACKKQIESAVESLQKKYQPILDRLRDEFSYMIDQKKEELFILKAKQEAITDYINTLINSKKDKLSLLKNEENVIKRKISVCEKRIEELKGAIEDIHNNNREMLRQQNEILKHPAQDNHVVMLLIHNGIQQNMNIEEGFRNRMQEYFNSIEELKSKLFENQITVKTISKEIQIVEEWKKSKNIIRTIKPGLQENQKESEDLFVKSARVQISGNEFNNIFSCTSDLLNIRKETKRIENDIESLKKKQFLQNVTVIQEPSTILISEERSTELNAVLASVTAFCIMIFISFFIEYFLRYRKNKMQPPIK